VNTGTAIVLVAIAGGAIYLVLRNQQQQQQTIAAAAAAAAPAPAGGGISGLASRLFNQWKGDPLGIKNAGALVHGVKGVATSAAGEVGSLVHGISSIF